MKLNEMDEKLRRLERLASSGDPQAIEGVRANKLRSAEEWKVKMYNDLQMRENDVITASIFPQMINRTIPLEERIKLLETIMSNVFPKHIGQIEPYIQAVLDGDYPKVNRMIREIDPVEGPYQYEHLLDTWVRILAGVRGAPREKEWLEGRVKETIAKIYYDRSMELENVLLKAIEEMIFS